MDFFFRVELTAFSKCQEPIDDQLSDVVMYGFMFGIDFLKAPVILWQRISDDASTYLSFVSEQRSRIRLPISYINPSGFNPSCLTQHSIEIRESFSILCPVCLNHVSISIFSKFISSSSFSLFRFLSHFPFFVLRVCGFLSKHPHTHKIIKWFFQTLFHKIRFSINTPMIQLISLNFLTKI